MSRKVVDTKNKTNELENTERNLSINMSNDSHDELKNLIITYYHQNQEKKSLDVSVKSLNEKIKNYMTEHNLNTFDFDEYSTKKSTVENCKFDEELLVQIIKSMGRLDLIKTKEYVDLYDLEREIYQSSLDASKLAPAQIITEVTRLTVNKKSLKG